MVAKVSITLKNTDGSKTQKKEFLVYEDFIVNQEDAHLQDLIKECKEEFHDEIDSIKIRIGLEVV